MSNHHLAEKIHHTRISKGMTQKELATLCKVDVRTIQRIEAGEVTPRMYTLRLIATAFEMSLEELLTLSVIKSGKKEKPSPLYWNYMLGWIGGVSLFTSSITVILLPVLVKGFFSQTSLIAFSTVAVLRLVSSLLFYRSYFYLGKRYQNRFVCITSLTMLAFILAADIFALAHLFFEPSYVVVLNFIETLLPVIHLAWGFSLVQLDIPNKILIRIAAILQIACSIAYFQVNSTSPWIGKLLVLLPLTLQGVIILLEARRINPSVKNPDDHILSTV